MPRKSTGATLAESKPPVKHTHAKVGGGTLTHTHSPDDHRDTDNPAHDGLLKHPKLSEAGAVLRLDFAESTRIEAGEKRVPFLTVTQADFDDYGHFEVTPQDLQNVKRLFDDHARRQDVPALLDIEVFGEVNEEHNEHTGPGRAVGWVKALEFNGSDRLDAIVDLNPVGDQVLANDQYRYVSPELLRNWKDPELGVIYPLVATGLAFTNKPRLKSLGRIAASETTPAVSLLAMSEGPVTGPPRVAARQMLAENDPDDDGDDDGPCPPCVYQPPYSPIGCCPGFTRRGDADGDGTCLLAEKGCNGYLGVAQSGGVTPLPMAATTAFNEGNAMPESTSPEATEPTAPQTAPAPDAGSEPAEETQASANLSETSAILAAERAERQKLQNEVLAMREEIDRQKTAAKLAEANTRLERLAAEGKVTPAEVAIFSEKMAELAGPSAWLFEALDKRAPVIRFGEVGTAQQDTPGTSDAQRLDTAAKAHMAEAKQRGETVKYRDAVLHVSRVGYRG